MTLFFNAMTLFFNISQWFDDLKKSWNEDFVPKFLEEGKWFLIALAAILAVVLIILFVDFIRWLAKKKNK